jgi:tetratricopeptide (TPR) repeat protein
MVLAGALALLSVDVGHAKGSVPKEELNRIINDSAGFLKNREPEMTNAEYALYEKVVAMLQVQPDFAMQLLDSMMAGKEQPSPAFEFVLGNAHYSAGRFADSEAHYRKAIERYPDYLRAWANLGVLSYSQGRYGEAAQQLGRAVELGDGSADTLGLLAYAQQRTGCLAAAEMAYLRAVSTAPSNTDWIDGLCGLYIEGGQFKRAESLAWQLVQLKPRDTRYWLQYAGTILMQDRRADALVALESARSLHVANTELLLQLGDLYAHENYVDEAAAVYAEAMKESPDVGAARLINFARILGQQGQPDRALAVLAGTGDGLPAKLRCDFLEAKADLLSDRQKWADARGCLEALLAIEPMRGPALLALGKVHQAQGDSSGAQQAYSAAAQLPESSYLAHIQLAEMELRARHYQPCIDHLEQSLEREKSPAIQEYLGKIKLLASQNENSSR